MNGSQYYTLPIDTAFGKNLIFLTLKHSVCSGMVHSILLPCYGSVQHRSVMAECMRLFDPTAKNRKMKKTNIQPQKKKITVSYKYKRNIKTF